MSRGTAAARFPLAPLLERIAAGFDPIDHRHRRNVVSYVALRVGADRAAVHSARRNGLREDVADRWACAAGYHPAELWPESW